MTKATNKAPTAAALASALGPARRAWDGIISAIVERQGAVELEWRPSKLEFGSMCLLRQKKRTLAYLIPESGRLQVAVVLGERAVSLALASGLPERIKALIREARPYVEGRGIRFPVRAASDAAVVADLVAIKVAPPARTRAGRKA